ncbi:hypothetical protein [Bacteroides sp.]
MISWIIFAIIAVCVLLYCKLGKSVGHVPDFRKLFSVIALLVYATIMLVCCSCGSHKSNMKQETSIEAESNHQRKDTASFSEQVNKTEHEDVIETVEEVTIVYDTSQPADSLTGRSPVLSETTKTTRRESSKQKQEDKNTSLNQSAAVSDNQKAIVQDKKEEDKQKEETTVPRQIGWVVWGLVALLGVKIVGRLVYRWKN